MRWMSNKNRCGCAESGSCRIAWSPQREKFDRFAYAKASGQIGGTIVLHMRHFRELLELLHPDSLTEDDIDSGEVALSSAQETISWFHFERWHGPYFEVSQRC